MGRNGAKCDSNKVLKKSLKLFFTVSCLFTFSPLFANEQIVDKLVAEVGGDAIVLSEIQTKLDKGPLIEVSSFPVLETDDPKKVALNDLINKRLILQKASDLGIEVSDESLEQEIKGFLQRRNLSRDALNSALSQQGMTFDQYKEDFRTQMVINQFEGRELMPQIKVSDRDIQLYYIKTSGALAENIKLSLKQLIVQLPPNASESVRDAKKQIVEKAFQELEGGMPFEQAVKIYSDDESARSSGGVMPQLFLKDLAPVIQSAVKDLDEGKFSKPVYSGNLAYLFYVAKKEFAGSEDYQKQKPQLEAMLRQEEMGRLLSRWLEAQRRRTDIKIKE